MNYSVTTVKQMCKVCNSGPADRSWEFRGNGGRQSGGSKTVS